MKTALLLPFALLLSLFATNAAHAAQLLAGVAKVDTTDRAAGPVNDPSYVKAMVLKDGATTVVLVTVDAVAIGGIGRIGNDYLGKVRAELQRELGIPPASVLVNASHCHSVVRADTDARTVAARYKLTELFEGLVAKPDIVIDDTLSSTRAPFSYNVQEERSWESLAEKIIEKHVD